MIRTAACATAWWEKKFNSKLWRSVASATSPMRPCQAAPALEITISTPPKVAATVSNAFWMALASVTSQASPKPFALAAVSRAKRSSRSSTATSAPWAANASAVARPMPEPPPVTTTT